MNETSCVLCGRLNTQAETHHHNDINDEMCNRCCISCSVLNEPEFSWLEEITRNSSKLRNVIREMKCQNL